MRRALLFALVLCAVDVPVVAAGTVEVTRSSTVFENRPAQFGDWDAFGDIPVVVHREPPGEVGQVRVDMDGNRYVFSGAGLRSGPGCSPDPVGVVCSATGIGAVVAATGDMDDRFAVGPSVQVPAIVFGDAGNDVASGGSGEDLLSGGSGNDDLDGGPGADAMLGGEGEDTLRGGAGGGPNQLKDTSGGNDLFVCGTPQDVVLTSRLALPQRNLRTENCEMRGPDDLGMSRFRFTVFRGSPFTIPRLMEIKFPQTRYFGMFWRARCQGRGCRGLRFSPQKSRSGRFLYVRFSARGGIRARDATPRSLRRLPAVRTPATIQLEIETTTGYVKRIEFVTRRGRAPRRIETCLSPARGRIPCER